MAQSDTIASEASPPVGGADGEILARDALADATRCTRPAVDALAASLDALRLQTKLVGPVTTLTPKSASAPHRSDAFISPADFVNLQSMRSSALARKTNTTSKFSRDCRNLFADLLAPSAADEEEKKDKNDEKDAEKAVKEVKSEKKGEEKQESTSTDDEKAGVDNKSAKMSSTDVDEPVEGPSGEGKNSKTANEKKDVEDYELLSRGPVRASRAPHGFHPYGEGAGGAVYGTAAQSAVYDPTSFSADAYSYGYDCGATQFAYGNGQLAPPGQPPVAYGSARFYGSRESTPDTVLSSDLGYGSGSSPLQRASRYGTQQPLPYAHGQAPAVDYSSIDLESFKIRPSVSESDDGKQELPDALSDFILQYSRRYTSEGSAGASPASAAFSGSSGLSSAEASPLNYYGNDFDFLSSPNSNSNQHGIGSSHGIPASSAADASAGGSVCTSPLSAAGAPKCSPAQPHGSAHGDTAPPFRRAVGPAVGRGARPAKDRLRALINNNDMDEAWAWTCKCIQNYPGALCYRDADRDTLLHIVVLHADHAKIYALVEQMLKMESEFSGGNGGDLAAAARRQKPFDLANRAGETPLFLAVKKRDGPVVDYLLEAGAQPNVRSLRADRDTPLHHAAGRGMVQIVEILCAYPHTDVNLTNGAGVTPLLHAIRRHGAVDEEDVGAAAPIDSTAVVRALLRHGADPNIMNSVNGKTVFHYAVECRSEKLIALLHAELGDETACQLAERADHAGETPASCLERKEARGSAAAAVDEERVRLRQALSPCCHAH